LLSLHPEKLGLLAGDVLFVLNLLLDRGDFPGLLAEGLARIPGGDYGEDGKDEGSRRGEKRHAKERHGEQATHSAMRGVGWTRGRPPRRSRGGRRRTTPRVAGRQSLRPSGDQPHSR
jgi:hypothetical protein